jgi:type III secretion protein Q
MIPLPRHRRDELRALNRIFCRREAVLLELGGERLALRPVAELPLIEEPLELELELDGRLVSLALDRAIGDRLVASVLDGLEQEQLDPALLAMLLELGLAPLIERLEALTGRRVRIHRLGSGAGPERHSTLGFALEPEGGGVPFHARLQLSPESLEVVATALERSPLAAHPADTLPMQLVCRVGSSVLTRGEILASRPGDFVLLAHTAIDRGEVQLMLGPGTAYRARLDHETITILGGPSRAMSDDAATEDGRVEVEEAPDLDSVPVTLTFELGRLAVPLGELRTLGEGYTFDLGRDLRSPVDIVAGGKKIGSGELVQIDERVGVRITRLFAHE